MVIFRRVFRHYLGYKSSVGTSPVCCTAGKPAAPRTERNREPGQAPATGTPTRTGTGGPGAGRPPLPHQPGQLAHHQDPGPGRRAPGRGGRLPFPDRGPPRRHHHSFRPHCGWRRTNSAPRAASSTPPIPISPLTDGAGRRRCAERAIYPTPRSTTIRHPSFPRYIAYLPGATDARRYGCPALRMPGATDARRYGCPALRMPGATDARRYGCPALRMPGATDARRYGCPALRMPQPYRRCSTPSNYYQDPARPSPCFPDNRKTRPTDARPG